MTPVSERLCRVKENRGVTWRQLAHDLGVSLSMLLMVKSGARTLGPDVVARLEKLEKRTPNLPPPPLKEARGISGRTRVRLTAADRERGFVEVDVSYRRGADVTGLPSRIRVSQPKEPERERVRKVVGDTWEVKIAIIACLPREVAYEDYLEVLSTETYLTVQSVALSFVFGDRWRTILAKAVVEGLIGPPGEADRIIGREPRQKS